MAATIKTGSKALKMKNTAVATTLRGPIFPVTEGRRYNLMAEVQADSVSAGRTVTLSIDWLDSAQAVLTNQIIFDGELTTADTWQAIRAALAPPNGARYARPKVAKAAQTFNVIWDRIRIDECCNNLDDVMSEITLKDDFSKDGTAAPWGDTGGWNEFAFTNVTVSKVSAGSSLFDQYSEFGVIQVQSPTTNGQGGGLIYGSLTRPLLYGRPPVGFEFRQKVNIPTTMTGFVAWAGLWSSTSTYPDSAGANTISGIGFRADTTAAGANWYGIVRNGTAQSTVDLGVVANATWRMLGWRRTLTGVQFQVGDVDVGSALSTNLPATTATMNPLFGIVTTGGGTTKELKCDAVGLRSFHNRYAA